MPKSAPSCSPILAVILSFRADLHACLCVRVPCRVRLLPKPVTMSGLEPTPDVPSLSASPPSWPVSSSSSSSPYSWPPFRHDIQSTITKRPASEVLQRKWKNLGAQWRQQLDIQAGNTARSSHCLSFLISHFILSHLLIFCSFFIQAHFVRHWSPIQSLHMSRYCSSL